MLFAGLAKWSSNSSEKLKGHRSRGRSNGLPQKGHFLVLSHLTCHHFCHLLTEIWICSNRPKAWLERAAGLPPMLAEAIIPMSRGAQLTSPQCHQLTKSRGSYSLTSHRCLVFSEFVCLHVFLSNEPLLRFRDVAREEQLTTVTSESHKLANQYSFQIP